MSYTSTTKPSRTHTDRNSNPRNSEEDGDGHPPRNNKPGKGAHPPRKPNQHPRGGKKPQNDVKIGSRSSPHFSQPPYPARVHRGGRGGGHVLGGSPDKTILDAVTERRDINLAEREERLKKRDEQKQRELEAKRKEEHAKLEKRKKDVAINHQMEVLRQQQDRNLLRQHWDRPRETTVIDDEDPELQEAIKLSLLESQSNQMEVEPQSFSTSTYSPTFQRSNSTSSAISTSKADDSDAEVQIIKEVQNLEMNKEAREKRKADLLRQMQEIEKQEMIERLVAEQHKKELEERRRKQQEAKKRLEIDAESEMNRILREEQDLAYQESLAMDISKEQEASERKQLEEQMEIERQVLEQAKERKENNLRNTRENKKNWLLPEPDLSDPDVATLQIKMPDGSKHARRFLLSQAMQVLFDYIESLGVDRELPAHYEIRADFPTRLFSSVSGAQTLKEAGISKRELLTIINQ